MAESVQILLPARLHLQHERGGKTNERRCKTIFKYDQRSDRMETK